MPHRHYRRRRWALVLLFSGGLMLQTTTTTSCNEVISGVTAGLATSITTQFTRNLIYPVFGLPRPGGSLGGGLGT